MSARRYHVALARALNREIVAFRRAGFANVARLFRAARNNHIQQAREIRI